MQGKAIRVVGIGASAGGLKALKAFLSACRCDGETAFLVAQHLSPSHESMLVTLLAKETPLYIQSAEHMTAPQADTVYITPPNSDVEFRDGLIQLCKPAQQVASKPSVDRLFTSLAKALGTQSVGVVLSGTGGDGAAGLVAIKAAGGMTLVQDPASAEYDGMPLFAIQSGCADRVLPADVLGASLHELLSLEFSAGTDLFDQDQTLFQAMVARLGQRVNLNLSGYKSRSQYRRIRRRMAINELESLSDYEALLEHSEEERQALMRDLFIQVTAFFRDPDAFDLLRAELQEKLSSLPNGAEFRVWVAGCATGEEAYSIAILISDVLDSAGRHLPWRVFATDILASAIETARAGVYSKDKLESLSEAQREKWFVATDDGFRVRPDLREQVVFSVHNVVKDPPFSNLDLIVCRNVLIYFAADFQTIVFSQFAHSLKLGGMLFLGQAESVTDYDTVFSALNNRIRLFEKSAQPTRPRLNLVSPYATSARAVDYGIGPASVTPSRAANLRNQARRMIAEVLAPAAILIDQQDKIVFIHNGAERFLQVDAGLFTGYLLDVIRREWQLTLRALLFKARKATNETHCSDIWTTEDGQSVSYTMSVQAAASEQPGWLLVAFNPSAEGRLADDRPTGNGEERQARLVAELEEELRVTQRDLQLMSEELQTTNEELQSSNEELQATNEELQTSNEELQSSNEELRTLNEEMQAKNRELELLSLDLAQIEESLGIPIMVFDPELRLRRLSSAARPLLQSASIKVGDPLRSVRFRSPLPEAFLEQIEQLQPGSDVLQRHHVMNDCVYDLRVIGYADHRHQFAGVIFCLYDLTLHHKANQHLLNEIDRLHETLSSLGDAVVRVDKQGRIQFVNSAAALLLGRSIDSMRDRNWDDLIGIYEDGQTSVAIDVLQIARAGHLRGLLRSGFLQMKDSDLLGQEVDFSVSPVTTVDQQVVGYTIAIKDLSESERLIAQLNKQRLQLQHAQDLARLGIIETDLVENVTEWSDSIASFLGLPADVHPKTLDVFTRYLTEESRDHLLEKLVAISVGEQSVVDLALAKQQGATRFLRGIVSRQGTRVTVVVQDITQSHQTKRAIERERQKLDIIVTQALDAIVGIDAQGCIRLFNPQAEKMFGYLQKDVLESNVSMLMPEPHRTAHDDYLKTYLQGRPAEIVGKPRELQAITANGRLFPILLKVSEVEPDRSREQHPDMIRFVGIIQDITDIKAHEEQLRQANKMQAIGQLVGGVAHDFNNIVGIVSGNLELLMMSETLVDDEKECVRDALKATKRARQLTKRLLQFSRPVPVRQTVVECHALLTGLKPLVEKLLPKEQHLILELYATQTRILVDEGDLEDAIINLLVNARDAMPAGGDIKLVTRDVTVAAELVTSHAVSEVIPGRYLVIAVQDSGEGMPPDVQERIFEPFFSTKPLGKGTGLGLSQVYGFCKRSKGFIDLQSQAGFGTSFKLCLPLVNDSGEQVETLPESVREIVRSRGNEHVLVVDDEADLGHVLARGLSLMGYQIHSFSTPQSVLHYLEGCSHPVDLLITDVVMPGDMHGVELARAVRKLQPEVRVLLMTGYSADVEPEPGMTVLHKPFDISELATEIEGLFYPR